MQRLYNLEDGKMAVNISRNRPFPVSPFSAKTALAMAS